jgi:GntP family gluconate:H+ symporter
MAEFAVILRKIPQSYERTGRLPDKSVIRHIKFGEEFMTQFFVILFFAIVLLVLLIVKIRMHPVLALFIVGLLSGLGFGFGFNKTITTMVSAFGGTLTGIGCTIIFGSIIAMGIQDSGAIKSMVNFFIRLSKGKRLELTTAMAGFIMSIPIFGDITIVMLSPIASYISKRKKVSMASMGGWAVCGLGLTMCLVPPTPGILASALLLGADVGQVIIWGIVISLFSLALTYLLCSRFCNKEWIPPREDYVTGVETVSSGDYHDLLIKEEGLPNVCLAALPILLPVVLIAANSYAITYLSEENPLRVFLGVIGERNIAMFIGVIAAMLLGLSLKSKVIDYFKINTGTADNSIGDIMLNKWVDRALKIALLPLLITAMGGAFSAIIKAYPDINNLLSNALSKSNFPGILLPWIMAAIMMTAVGSQTTATMTTSAIVLPMMGSLGLSPAATAFLIGSGVMVGSHVNNSGFWVAAQMFNFTTVQAFKYITFIGTVAGIFGLVLTAIFHSLGMF